MPPVQENEKELETLREENTQVKKQLASLQEEFTKLQDYVKDLEQKSSETKETSEEEKKDDNLSQFQILVERCNTLEQANAQLQVDSQMQRQQYEKCLDKVASQVVQAILVQKTQQEQCERLSKKVEMLKKQNVTLTSFIASKGKFQSLNHRRRGHLLPIGLTDSNSQSLPNTLIKPKIDCDTTNKPSDVDNSSGSWYNSNADNSSTSHPDTLKTSRTNSDELNQGLPCHGFSSLPQSRSSKKRSLRQQSSADGCWYDIIKSLHKGDQQHLSVSHSIVENPNLSSDSSSVDTEEQSLDSQRRTLPCIEDSISTSSSGDDFHSSFPTSRSQQQQGENSSSFPSNTASKKLSVHNPDRSSLVTSSQSPKPKGTERRNPDITLDFVPQSSNHQNIVVNFSHNNTSPDLSNKADLPLTCSSAQLNTVSPYSSSLSSPLNKAKNGNSLEIERGSGTEPEAKAGEVIVKDEGYSTMSSDVQSEVKENIAVVTISTVEEEKGKSFDGESETKESSPTGTLKNKSTSRETLEVEKTNNKKNLSLGVVSMTIKDCESTQPEYSEGLRVIYDEEDNDSDILFVPIADEKDKYLRHSFNFPFPEEPVQLQRCSSDSYLYKLFVRFPNSGKITSKKLSTNQNTLQSLPLKHPSPNNLYNTYLKRAYRKESLKKGCLKLFSRPLVPKNNNVDNKTNLDSINYNFLSQMYPNSLSHPRILSPSYSHAEMEDWSLDLSGEDITTPGGTEPSAAESSAPSHHQSHPSIQEATLELEEDHHDFLWNGATYFKADDNDLSWPFDKTQGKDWDLNLMANKQCRSMISPKSGCSDQPAMWSSSEQLSCCSDIASKCSTDIENFCEQLCNLPELKRVSACSSENGGNESLPSNPKLSEIDSNEDTSEIIDDINVETVFTRDFYRLVKFESTRSLTASCKSLATSEGFLTLEKLKGLESIHSSKTLASVLGFIAEQQKYCKDREVMDENASFGPLINRSDDRNQNQEASFHIQISEDSQSNNEMENIPESRNVQDNVLTSSESLSCLDLNSEFRSSFSASRQSPNPPPKPKRSTSLNLGVRGGRSYRSRGTLPPLPSNYSPPPIPSRSTSRSTLPHHNVFKPCRKTTTTTTTEIPEEPFPPPPPPIDDSYVEPYHAIPMAPPPPKVPPHRIPIPNIPRRSSSMTYKPNLPSETASPPVPKRITSRALPTPPKVSIPPRTTSLKETGVASSNGQSHTHHGKGNRPKSLLREATVSNAVNKSQGKQRGSCGDLGPLCRNSATLMLELQKMAKAEEEEKGSGFYSPEATSPGTEVGLGTGWVRIEPVSDLGDPQTRANLLDTMLQSSEGCSSETDEDLAKHLQHNELLKAVQRNRRKRKASRHSGSDPLKVVGWGHGLQRPSIIGRNSLFNRFGEEEEGALREFQFLESFPSQSDIQVGDSSSPRISTHHAVPEGMELSSYPPGGLNPYVRFTKDLKNLRSSEPCPEDGSNFTISTSVSHPASLSQVESTPQSSGFRAESNLRMDRSRLVDSSQMNRTCLSGSNDLGNCPSSDKVRSFKESKFNNNLFPSFEKISNVHSSGATDNKFHYQDVPSARPDKNQHNGIINKSNNPYSSNIRQSTTRESCSELKQVCLTSKIPLKNNSRTENNSAEVSTPCEIKEEELIDTRSLNNVQAIIQKLNSRNQSSGKHKVNSGICRKNIQSQIYSASNTYSKPVSFSSTKTSVEKDVDPNSPADVKNNNNNDDNSTSKYSSSDQKYASVSKRNPKIPGSSLIKRLTANSPQSRELSPGSSLPPKGIALSKASPKGNILGKGLRSPRLPRFKIGSSKNDPLASFTGKSMCDSGSSEGSEKGCGRISISDSCAEIFSPGESGDEVFHRNT